MAAWAQSAWQGSTLEQALERLERQGLKLIYSSTLIKPGMRVTAEPAATDASGLLLELLAPFGLTARPGPGRVLMIVRAPAARGAGPNVGPGSAGLPRSRFAPPPLEEVIVTTSRYELERAVGASVSTLSAGDLEQLPRLGDDALRAVARLPGVASNGFSALANVRGGEAGDTLVRFDAVPLHNPFHLRDFQSVFSSINPRVIDAIDVYTGGFPAALGGRMGSVIDVAALPIPEEPYHELGVSFFNSSGLATGRFAAGKGGWLAAARRGNLDLLYNAFSKLPQRPRYSDAFAAVTFDATPGLRVSGQILYFEDDVSLADDLEMDEQASADLRDRYVWMRLDQRPAPRLSGVTHLSHALLDSERRGTTDVEGVGRGSLTDAKRFSLYSLQSDWSWTLSEALTVGFGARYEQAAGRYDYVDAVELDVLLDVPGAQSVPLRQRSLHLRPRGDSYAAHGSFRLSPTPRLDLELGLRWEAQTLPAQQSTTVGPRLAARYELGPATSLRASWGRFHQPQWIDEVQVSDGVQVFLPPQRADHTVLGVEHVFASGAVLRIEAYEKGMRRLRPRYENLLNPLTLLPELMPDRIRVAPEAARARGIEVHARGRLKDALSWSVAYGRSSAEDRLQGYWQRRSWDQTDALTAEVAWQTAKWQVAVALAHRSGWPTTAVALATDDDEPVIRAGPRNGERVDFYRSVDVRATREFVLESGRLSVYAELTNLFGRQNPCCFEYEVVERDDGLEELELSEANYLPRVPSLGFVWSF